MDNMSDFMKMFGDKLGADPSKFESLFQMFQSSSNDAKPNDNPSNPSFEMPDIETILKIKKVMEHMNSNSNDPIINLLLSLKPFIQDSKKSIIDQLIKFIGISSALSFFNEGGF